MKVVTGAGISSSNTTSTNASVGGLAAAGSALTRVLSELGGAGSAPAKAAVEGEGRGKVKEKENVGADVKGTGRSSPGNHLVT